MFGKSEWFAAGPCGCVAKPAGRAGWMYLGAWAAVVALPAIALGLVQQDWLVPLFWALPALAAFAFDLNGHARTLAAKRRQERDLFFIGYDGDGEEVATPNYDLRLRR